MQIEARMKAVDLGIVLAAERDTLKLKVAELSLFLEQSRQQVSLHIENQKKLETELQKRNAELKNTSQILEQRITEVLDLKKHLAAAQAKEQELSTVAETLEAALKQAEHARFSFAAAFESAEADLRDLQASEEVYKERVQDLEILLAKAIESETLYQARVIESEKLLAEAIRSETLYKARVQDLETLLSKAIQSEDLYRLRLKEEEKKTDDLVQSVELYQKRVFDLERIQIQDREEHQSLVLVIRDLEARIEAAGIEIQKERNAKERLMLDLHSIQSRLIYRMARRVYRIFK